MPGENVQDWSTTALDNDNADSLINWTEGMPRADVNNSARSMMAAIAKVRNLQNGSIATTGSTNAQAFISGVTYTSVPTGLVVKLKIGPALTNTTTATLNMDSIGAVTIKNQYGNNLAGGELLAGSYVDFRYDGTNWILLTPAPTGPTNVRVFLSSSTYPAATSLGVKVMVYCKGGGGSGGSSNDSRLGGGGGEGAESWKLLTAGQLSGQTVTIGAGGAASVSQGVGNLGGTTSIGTLITAPGGAGATVGHFGGAGASGGSGGTKDYGMPGAGGHSGGDSTLGTVGIASRGGGKGGGGSGSAGVANSGGGGGGVSSSGISGAGGSGIVVCTEYGAI